MHRIAHLGPCFDHVTHGHLSDFDLSPGTAHDFLGITLQHIPCATAHHA